MRLLKNIFLFFVLLNLYSCRKVIDIKVKESDTKYVIEGIITNEPGSCKVYISQTRPFNESNDFPQVSGAIVKIKDNGVEMPLTESAPGVYENASINGTSGH